MDKNFMKVAFDDEVELIDISELEKFRLEVGDRGKIVSIWETREAGNYSAVIRWDQRNWTSEKIEFVGGKSTLDINRLKKVEEKTEHQLFLINYFHQFTAYTEAFDKLVIATLNEQIERKKLQEIQSKFDQMWWENEIPKPQYKNPWGENEKK